MSCTRAYLDRSAEPHASQKDEKQHIQDPIRQQMVWSAPHRTQPILWRSMDHDHQFRSLLVLLSQRRRRDERERVKLLCKTALETASPKIWQHRRMSYTAPEDRPSSDVVIESRPTLITFKPAPGGLRRAVVASVFTTKSEQVSWTHVPGSLSGTGSQLHEQPNVVGHVMEPDPGGIRPVSRRRRPRQPYLDCREAVSG